MVAVLNQGNILALEHGRKMFDQLVQLFRPAQWKITVVDGLDDETIIITVKERTYLSVNVLDPNNTRPLVAALLREYAVQQLGFPEESRDLESWLLERLVDAGEALLRSPETPT